MFEACARFMEQQIDDTNCVGILSFAHIHHCQHLSTKAMEHIEKNFQQVVGQDYLLLLTAGFNVLYAMTPCMQAYAYCMCCDSSVCLLITLVNCVRMAKKIELPL